jgi:hypothetical protein
VALSWTLATPPAHGDELRVCNEALVRGQELARASRLLEARATYPTCLRAACDVSLRAVCASFLTELGARVPSVAVTARDASGREPKDVRIYVDGILASARSVEVDPGAHTVRVEAPGHAASTVRATVAEGQRDHPVVVPLVAVPPPRNGDRRASPARSSRPSPPLATVFVLGGVSALALGSFGFFALRGKQTESDLRERCSMGPCETAPMRREYLAADLSLAVGLVALAAAAWIFLTRDATRPTARPPF